MIPEPGIRNYSIHINGFDLNFICKHIPGSEEAVLFLHGLACTRDTFRNVFDKDYFPGKSLLLPDFPGFGRSSKPESFTYTMHEHAGLICKLLTNLPPWSLHIAAHSMGGAVALLFNDEIFSRIISFTNIEGNLAAEDCGVMSRSIASLSFEVYRDRLYPKHVNAFNGHHQLRFEESTPAAIYKSAVSLVEQSDSGGLLEKFNNLSCRTSYFYGEENKDMPVIKMLNTPHKYMIPNSGHGMMTENPEEFYTKLAEFILN
jgi:pimeloyl-ACP methyl ester carboxylesterase